jgi:hypothetical protein
LPNSALFTNHSLTLATLLVPSCSLCRSWPCSSTTSPPPAVQRRSWCVERERRERDRETEIQKEREEKSLCTFFAPFCTFPLYPFDSLFFHCLFNVRVAPLERFDLPIAIRLRNRRKQVRPRRLARIRSHTTYAGLADGTCSFLNVMITRSSTSIGGSLYIKHSQ